MEEGEARIRFVSFRSVPVSFWKSVFSLYIYERLFERFIKPGMSENAVNYTRFGEGWEGERRRRERKKMQGIERSARIFKDEKSWYDVDVEIRKFSCFTFRITSPWLNQLCLNRPTLALTSGWNNSIARIQNTRKTRALITNYPAYRYAHLSSRPSPQYIYESNLAAVTKVQSFLLLPSLSLSLYIHIFFFLYLSSINLFFNATQDAQDAKENERLSSIEKRWCESIKECRI